ncbi:glycosyltransferase 87 family protein [Propionibacteriaceae bacterium Y2011]
MLARLRTGAIEFVLPFAVALLILPFVISGGSLIPWSPATTDLEVYVYAAKDLLAGKDVYQTVSPRGLFFIYPPIAAILMIPLAFGPYVVWQLVWTALLILSQNLVLARTGMRRGVALALVSACVVIAMEPIRTTLGYGQVNTMLMMLVIADLLPVKGRRRIIPQGALIGLAAAIKLTPLLFLVFLFLVGRRRAVVVGTITFGVLTVIGAVVMWAGTVEFFTGLVGGNTKTSGPQYVGNQSLVGVTTRLAGETTPATLAGLAIGGIVALLSVLVAAYWWQHKERAFGVALVGIATCLASPLSWTHHWVWVLPLGVLAMISERLPPWTRVTAGVLTVWVSICLPLTVLPYHKGAADSYTILQQGIANAGPVLGAALIVALAVRQVLRARTAAGTDPTMEGSPESTVDDTPAPRSTDEASGGVSERGSGGAGPGKQDYASGHD